jgi:hypothetical protein
MALKALRPSTSPGNVSWVRPTKSRPANKSPARLSSHLVSPTLPAGHSFPPLEPRVAQIGAAIGQGALLTNLGGVVDRIRTLRVLLLVTFRPEFEAPWIGQPHVTALTINRLTQRDVDAMIDRVVGNKLIPAAIRQDIIERTDGIPLFVEEMTKASVFNRYCCDAKGGSDYFGSKSIGGRNCLGT